MFEWPITIYYEDTDAGGVVYHANYLKYFERARTEWLKSLGIVQSNLLAQDMVFVVSHADINFRKAAKFEQQFVVTSQISSIKRVSMTFLQTLCDHNGHSYCEAKIKVACVKLSTMRPQAIPTTIVQEFNRAR